MKRAFLLVLGGLACGKAPSSVSDAAVERPATDAVRVGDAAPVLEVDFAVEGCPSFDSDNLSCTGSAPLALRFVPLVTTAASQYVWDFGDSSVSSSRFDTRPTPSHVYSLPGQYSVKLLVSGLDGVPVSATHEAFVTVIANDVGSACDMEGQCDDKLSCLCSSSNACTYGPPHGTCAGFCQSGFCPDGQACAGLATATVRGTAREPWQSSVCLRRCSADSDCAGGLRCRLLPPISPSTQWVQVCFGDFPVDVGQSCMDATNRLRDDLCSSGICASFGAKGMCTMGCLSQVCPPGSDCALLGDGRELCLRPCSASFSCSGDPLLGCVPPGDGSLGYHLVNARPDSAESYCASKECSSDADCLPAGKCDSESNGHCVAQTD